MTTDQRQAEVEQTWRGLIAGEIEDEELSRLFLGSALDPDPYEPLCCLCGRYHYGGGCG